MSEFDHSSYLSIGDVAEQDPWAFFKDLEEIGPYRIQSPLGSGGMAKAFKGQNRRTGADVAIKVLRPELFAKKNVLQRFQSEFRAARKLFHPNLVRAFDFGVEQGVAYLVLEYVDGPSLLEWMREKIRLHEAEAIRVILQVAEGLQLAHQMGLVHRDIKPGNILMTSQGDAKLADLGLAKDLLSAESITQTGASLGTLIYMAPEQFQSARDADLRSDLYSLGITLYQLVTGRLPFNGGQLTMLQKKMSNQFVPPRDLVPELSPGLNRIICQVLRAAPDERPSSCAELISLLQSCVSKRLSAEIALNLGNIVPADKPDDRRVEERFPISLQSSCSVLLNPRKESWKGELLDLSSGGALFHMDRRFEIGSILAVDVDDEQLESPLSFMLRVTWVRPGAKSGFWHVGGKFHRRLPPSEMERLLHRDLNTVVVQEG